MSHCPGDNCNKREQCQKHSNSGQLIDWSNYGHVYGGFDENGKLFSYHEIECGDNGTYGYQHFEELKEN